VASFKSCVRFADATLKHANRAYNFKWVNIYPLICWSRPPVKYARAYPRLDVPPGCPWIFVNNCKQKRNDIIHPVNFKLYFSTYCLTDSMLTDIYQVWRLSWLSRIFINYPKQIRKIAYFHPVNFKGCIFSANGRRANEDAKNMT